MNLLAFDLILICLMCLVMLCVRSTSQDEGKIGKFLIKFQFKKSFIVNTIAHSTN